MTLQLTGDLEPGTFIIGMCYKFRLWKLLHEKRTLTMAVKDQLRETRLRDAAAICQRLALLAAAGVEMKTPVKC